MIEEAMIAANVAVAHELHTKNFQVCIGFMKPRILKRLKL